MISRLRRFLAANLRNGPNGAGVAAAGRYRVDRSKPDALTITLQIGSASYAYALDDTIISQVADRWEPHPNGTDMEYELPAGKSALLRVRNPFNLTAIFGDGVRPPFLAFDTVAAFPDMPDGSHFLVRVKGKGASEPCGYHITLNNPQLLAVPIPRDLERIELAIRLRGAGRLSPVALSLGLPVPKKVDERQLNDLARRRMENNPQPTEVDWPSFLDPEADKSAVAALFAAQADALSSHVKPVMTVTKRLLRQIDDLEQASDAKQSEPMFDVTEVRNALAEAFAAASTSERKFNRAIGLLRTAGDADPMTAQSTQSYERLMSDKQWRRELAERALPMNQESDLFTVLSFLWRQPELAESRMMLEELVDCVGAQDAEFVNQCLVFLLAIEPSRRRAQHVAAKAFKYGMIDRAMSFLEQAGDLPDSRFIAELRLASFLRSNADSLIPHRTSAKPTIRDGVVYVTAGSLPFLVNGYASRTQSLAGALGEHGVAVRCITRPGFPWDRPNILAQDAMNRTESIVDGVRYQHLETRPVEDDPLDYIQSAAVAIETALQDNPPAVIHAASNYRNGLPALIAARRLGAAFVYEVRGLWELSAASKKPGWEDSERFAFERDMERLLFKEADAVLTITEAVGQELARGLDGRLNIRTLANGVDTVMFRPTDRDVRLADRLGIADEEFTLVYAGSLVAYEGVDDVIRAVGILRDQGIAVKFLIVGDGETRPELEQLVKELDLEDHVIFRGKVRPEQVRFFLSLADVVPVVRKNYRVCRLVSPLKPFEAMAMAKPVIVSDLAALTEIVEDGVTGRICSPENPTDLARVLAELCGDQEQVEKLGRQAHKQAVEDFAWPNRARELAVLYDELQFDAAAETSNAPSPLLEAASGDQR